ncbi:hypothetical protein K0U07_00680 [bacterium]|nr:hypothetical protein [bacterium]
MDLYNCNAFELLRLLELTQRDRIFAKHTLEGTTEEPHFVSLLLNTTVTSSSPPVIKISDVTQEVATRALEILKGFIHGITVIDTPVFRVTLTGRTIQVQRYSQDSLLDKLPIKQPSKHFDNFKEDLARLQRGVPKEKVMKERAERTRMDIHMWD